LSVGPNLMLNVDWHYQTDLRSSTESPVACLHLNTIPERNEHGYCSRRSKG